jgi:hypothetical protein
VKTTRLIKHLLRISKNLTELSKSLDEYSVDRAILNARAEAFSTAAYIVAMYKKYGDWDSIDWEKED